jgi:hypothetical protein
MAVELTEYQQSLADAVKASDHAQVERLIEIRGQEEDFEDDQEYDLNFVVDMEGNTVLMLASEIGE